MFNFSMGTVKALLTTITATQGSEQGSFWGIGYNSAQSPKPKAQSPKEKNEMKTAGCAVLIIAFLWVLLPAAVSFAGEADVVGVKASSGKDGTWSFSVTVRHDDVGWDHYADKWEVLGPEGEVLGTRVLLHPHVSEQPFTRSLGGIEIPEGITEAVIRARDSVHGYGGKEVVVELPEK
jgi:hypothetical protein